MHNNLEPIHYANIESVIITGPEHINRDFDERYGKPRNRYMVIVENANFEWIDPLTRDSGKDDLTGSGLKLDDAVYLALRYIEPSLRGDIDYVLNHLFQRNEQVSVTLRPLVKQAIIKDNDHREYGGEGINLSSAVTAAFQEMTKRRVA